MINRQAAIDMFLAEPGRESREIGVVIPTTAHWGRLADLLLARRSSCPPLVTVRSRRSGVRPAAQEVDALHHPNGAILCEDAEGPGGSGSSTAARGHGPHGGAGRRARPGLARSRPPVAGP